MSTEGSSVVQECVRRAGTSGVGDRFDALALQGKRAFRNTQHAPASAAKRLWPQSPNELRGAHAELAGSDVLKRPSMQALLRRLVPPMMSQTRTRRSLGVNLDASVLFVW